MLGEQLKRSGTLEAAVEASAEATTRIQFDATFALFVRATVLPVAGGNNTGTDTAEAACDENRRRLRIGRTPSLAVARVEGLRGHCVDAHRHLEIARRLSDQQTSDALSCSVDLVESSLELVAGNLTRFRGWSSVIVSGVPSHRDFRGFKVGARTKLWAGIPL